MEIFSLADELKKKKVHPSQQRIQILGYLADHQTHPTVDRIFHDLKDEMPTLSKATVYNTIKTFVRAGLAREITIEENEVRYDVNVSDHGHFKCETCGKIYDFEIDLASLPTAGLTGFQINDRNVYYKGICKNCLLNNICVGVGAPKN